MTLRTAVCVALIASLFVDGAAIVAREQAPITACKPECEAPRLRWEAEEEAFARDSRLFEQRVAEEERLKTEVTIAERLVQAGAKDAKSQASLTAARDGAVRALEQVRGEREVLRRRLNEIHEARTAAREAYLKCCGTASEPTRLPEGRQLVEPLYNPPATACRPECEDARLEWVEAVDRHWQARERLRAAESAKAATERALREAAADADSAARAQRRGAATAGDVKARQDRVSRLRIDLTPIQAEVDKADEAVDYAFEVLEDAKEDYDRCCKPRTEQGGVAWPWLAGAGGGVAAIATAIGGGDSPATTGSAPASSPTTTTPPTVTPPPQAPPSNPTPPSSPPPASPMPTDGTTNVGDLGGARSYRVRFSDSNVDFLVRAQMALTQTDCLPPFFVQQFTAEIGVSGTGAFNPPSGTVVGTGSGTFVIAGETLRGELTITIVGTTVVFEERLYRTNCFGHFIGRMVVAGF